MPGLWKLYWLTVATTLAVYAVMLGWSLPYLTQAAGGLLPFDVRPTGYTAAEGRDFLQALFADGAEARDFFLNVQHRLDMAFPVLVAISLASPLIHLSKGWPHVLRWLIALLPWLGAGFDYAENALVGEMLRALPELPSDRAVDLANRMTVFKSGLITAAVNLLLLLLIIAMVKRYRRERNST